MTLLGGAPASGQQEPSRDELFQEILGLRRAGSYAAVLDFCADVLEDSRLSPNENAWIRIYAAHACAELALTGRGHDYLDAVSDAQDSAVRCWALLLRARLYLAIGRPDLAQEPVKESLLLAEDLELSAPGNAATLHEVRLSELRILLAVGNSRRSEEKLKLYLADDLYTGRDNALADLHYDRGLVAEQMALETGSSAPDAIQDLASAETAFELAVDHYERDLGDRLHISEELSLARTALARVRLAQSRDAAVGGLLAAARTSAGTQPSILLRETLLTMEARLSVRESSGKRQTELLQEIEETVQQAVERWRATDLGTAGLGLLHFRQSRTLLSEYTALATRALGESKGAQRAVQLLLSIQGLGTLSRDEAPEGVTLAAVQRWLGRDRGLLLYLPASRGSRVFAIDAERVIVAPAPGIHELERTRSSHVRILGGDPEAPQLAAREEELARRLGDQLLPATIVERLKRWRAVSVSGLESMGHVPIAMAVVAGLGERSEPGRLGLELAIDSPGAVPFAVARGEHVPAAPTQHLFLVGGVEPASAVTKRWPRVDSLRLPDSLTRRLLEGFDAERSQIAPGDQATLKSLQTAPLGDFAIAHLLVHGVRDPARQRPVGLVLAPYGDAEGVVFAQDIVELRQAPRAVLLTACRSGEGPARPGDPHSTDLAGAWLAAGARVTLVTRSAIRYGDAIEISCALYAELTGEPIGLAEALRRARASAAKDDPNWPFRFGLIDVIGLGHEPLILE